MIHLFKTSHTRLLTRVNKIRLVFTLTSRGFSHFSGDFEPESWKLMEGLSRCPANYVPLSPVSFLDRAAMVYGDRTSLVYGSVKFTWSQTHQRCLKLASAITQLGISRGDVVATLSPNVPAMYELHFAVPMAGAVLCTLNPHHDSNMISIILRHSGAKIIYVDYELLEVARGALDILSKADVNPSTLILIPKSADSSSPASSSPSSNICVCESLLETGQSEFEIRRTKSEWDPISVNYTSGITSRPKGVVYSYRGAYLNSLATVLLHEMGSMPAYLWTVPMFHCNGWCLISGVAAQGGINICLREVMIYLTA